MKLIIIIIGIFVIWVGLHVTVINLSDELSFIGGLLLCIFGSLMIINTIVDSQTQL